MHSAIQSPMPDARVTQPAPCKHLIDGYCEWASNRFGRPFRVEPIICNVTCRTLGGPYCGRPTTAVGEKRFLKECWPMVELQLNVPLAEQGPEFTERVMGNHAKPAAIGIPPEWGEIQEALAFLKDEPGFRTILLTGSLLLKDKPRPVKDYDIILWFSGIRSMLTSGVMKRLPVTIGGVKTDYFVFFNANGDPSTLYFATLDPLLRKLYTSSWFNLDLKTIDPDIEVVRVECTELDGLIKEILTKYRESDKSLWDSVKYSWNQAGLFQRAVMSRGLRSTLMHATGINKTAGDRVSKDLHDLRVLSCFGGGESEPCSKLRRNPATGAAHCGACGCPANSELAQLTGPKGEIAYDGQYTKLMYPALQCPLNRPGFAKGDVFLA